ETLRISGRGQDATGFHFQQIHRGAINTRIGTSQNVVVVLVDVHMAGQRALGRLREAELYAHATGSQQHATDHTSGGGVAGGEGASHIGTGAIADRTRRVGLRHAVDRIAARLLLGDGVAVLVGRRKVIELVVAIGRGLD